MSRTEVKSFGLQDEVRPNYITLPPCPGIGDEKRFAAPQTKGTRRDQGFEKSPGSCELGIDASESIARLEDFRATRAPPCAQSLFSILRLGRQLREFCHFSLPLGHGFLARLVGACITLTWRAAVGRGEGNLCSRHILVPCLNMPRASPFRVKTENYSGHVTPEKENPRNLPCARRASTLGRFDTFAHIDRRAWDGSQACI